MSGAVASANVARSTAPVAGLSAIDPALGPESEALRGALRKVRPADGGEESR